MTRKEKHMIAKNYLQRGRDIQRKITQLYETRSNYIDRATSTTMAISPVKVQTSHSGQGLENAIIGMVDTEEKIRNKIAELQMQQWNLQKEIQQVHGLPYTQMLYKIFIERKSYDVARKEVNLKPFNGQYNRKFLLRDAIDAFADCHPEIFEQEGNTEHE